MVGCRPSFIHLLFSLVLCFSIHASAQTKAFDEVSVDLGSGVLGANGIPFDVPFIVKGDVDPSYWMIKMKYKIKDGDYKSWMRFPKKGAGMYSDSVVWKAVPQKEFRLLSGPLHPNVTYIYEFTIYQKTALEDKVKAQFKQGIMGIIEQTMKDLGTTGERIEPANDALNTKMQALFPAGMTILDKDLRPFGLDLNAYPVKQLTDEIVDINLKRLLDSTFYKRTHLFFASAEYKEIQQKLAALITNPGKLTKADSVKYGAVIDSTNAAFPAIRFSDFAILFSRTANNPGDIIRGISMLKTDGSKVLPAKDPDLAAIALLNRFFGTLGQNLEDTTGNPLLSAAAIQALTNMLPNIISKGMEVHQRNSGYAAQRAAIVADFPDILDDKLIAYTVTSYTQSISDVVSEKNPYIGLDFGVSYIPGYEQLFFYEGVNFYFAPVNKDAPLSTFPLRGASFREWISKRFSLHFGLTQSLIEVGNKRYAPLLKGLNSSLLAGVGLRINRIVRLNMGYIFFYEKDNNPIVDQHHFTAMPQVSVTFDLNVGKALGGLGKRIGISQ